MVNGSVRRHSAVGLGIYTYFVNASAYARSAIIAPKTVSISHVIGKWLNGQQKSGFNNLVSDGEMCYGYGVDGKTDITAMGDYNTSTEAQACGVN